MNNTTDKEMFSRLAGQAMSALLQNPNIKLIFSNSAASNLPQWNDFVMDREGYSRKPGATILAGLACDAAEALIKEMRERGHFR